MLLVLGATLVAQTPRDVAMHVLNRVAFGPTPDLMTSLTGGGTAPITPSQYIANQLAVTNPVPDPSPDVGNLIAALEQGGFLPTSQGAVLQFPGEGLVASAVVRTAYSQYQLNELMTRFWNDHFNRSWDTIRFSPLLGPGGLSQGSEIAAWFMRTDDDYYRANALRYFDDLLIHTAGSVAMLIYLDNFKSTATELNENWGRELIELFSMGQVNQTTGASNYSQTDVVGVARCFTGWTVTGSGPTAAFGYDPVAHDTTPKTLFAGTPHSVVVPGTTPQVDGDLVLRALAGANATADYIVRKLMVQFFADDAPSRYPTLLASAKAVWGPRGDIRAVLNVLLQSPQFLSAADRWLKVKNPLRFDVSMLRATNTRAFTPFALFATVSSVGGMGQPVFSFPTPDGYPITNPKQLGVGGYLDRVASAERVLQEPNDAFQQFYPIFDVVFDPVAIVLNGVPVPQQANSQAVASFILRDLFADKTLNPGDAAVLAVELGTLPTPSPVLGGAYSNAIRTGYELAMSFTHFAQH